MLQVIAILGVFLLISGLMITRKIPTLLALPLLAVLIAAIAGVPLIATAADHKAPLGILNYIIETGAVRMASAYAAVIFGAWLGQILNRSGVTETIIKKSAELGGDRPLISVLVLSIVTALLFTVLSGLGSIIMVGTIVLPIFISIGIPAATAGCIFLMAFATGLALNVANWQIFISIFGVTMPQIRSFELVIAGLTALATIIFIVVQLKIRGINVNFAQAKNVVSREHVRGWRAPFAMLTPIIPIVLVAVLGVPIISAFLISILWALLFTQKSFSKAMNTLTKTAYDGVTDSAPAVMLMVGIGMLYLSVTHVQVKAILSPFMTMITPSTPWLFALFFIILAPLALYRGPLNLFGLGSGVAALMAGTGLLPVNAVMGGFLSAERIQGVGDPTNTQNVWVANFVGVDVNVITKTLLPYLWGITTLGVLYATFIYF